MDLTALVLFLLIGIVAGWLASTLMKGRGLGLVGNLIVGVIGAFLGGFLFNVLGLGRFLFNALGISAGGLAGLLITATVGAVVLLLLIRLIKSG
jgi:uncharacterized membrane protein YeaQ/YmgE (transglycosylase-associated protein family)